MKKISIVIIIFITCGFINHKYYVSTSLFNFTESNSVEITVRIFKDDLSSLMEEKYSNEYNSNSDLDSPLIQSKIREYLETNISIYFDNIKYHPKCLGTEKKKDLIVCYLELEKIPISNIIKLENKILFELFLDQKNIIHVKKNNNKQSFILTKDNSDYTLDI